MTNVCCETTVRDAVHCNAALDYPDMGWGEVSAEEVQRVTLTSLAFNYCQVSTTDEIVEELLQRVAASNA